MKVNAGFWNCCIARPAKAVKFIREETGETVWYAACASCASTVAHEKGRVKALPASFKRQQFVNRMTKAVRAGDLGELLFVANLSYDFGRNAEWKLKTLDVIKACDGTNWHEINQRIIWLNLYVS